MDMGFGDETHLQELVTDRETWYVVVHAVARSQMIERLNWTELNTIDYLDRIPCIPPQALPHDLLNTQKFQTPNWLNYNNKKSFLYQKLVWNSST